MILFPRDPSRATGDSAMTLTRRGGKTRFPELAVAGTPRELGAAIGEEFRDGIREMSDMALDRFNKSAARQVTVAEAENIARSALPGAEAFLPDAVEELRATADAAALPLHRLMLINIRSMLSAPEGCTSVMVGAGASASGVGMAGQNWDNDPEMRRFSAVITRRPDGKPAFMTWCQPGVIAYMGFNDRGIGICMNSLNGPSRRQGVGWYFLVRSMFEQDSLDGIVEMIGGQQRTMTANAALITREGPADIEITLDDVAVMRAGDDQTMAHTNHCVHSSLTRNNDDYADAIYGQSFDRKARAEELLDGIGHPVSVDDVKTILSDRQGYPTSINRSPNDDPATGWQRSVVSLIVEPDAGRMHVTRGNPGDNPYEVYELA